MLSSYLVDAEVRVRAVGERDGARGARELLHRERVVEVPEREPAVLRLDGDPEEAHVSEFLPEVLRSVALAFVALDAR